MPDYTHLPEEDIKAIMLTYIKSNGEIKTTTKATPASSKAPQRVKTPNLQEKLFRNNLSIREIEIEEERSLRLTSMFILF